MSSTEFLETAVEIARQAGDILREGFSRPKEIRSKSSGVDLVTQYDDLSERHIIGRLRALFPDHRLVGEEGGNYRGGNAGDRVWYIDPLDGTVNYAHGFPFYSISMALYEEDSPRLGLVYDPERGECFTAAAGEGACLRRDGRADVPLAVSGETELARSLLATGFPYDRQTSELDNVAQLRAFLKTARGVRRAGSAALDLCYVAAGRLDGFWEFKLKIWDVAAAALIVREAGGRVSHIDDGRPYTPRPLLDLFATTPAIHEQMAHVLTAVSASERRH